MGQVNLNALKRMQRIANHGTIDQVLDEGRLNPLFRKMFSRAYKIAWGKKKKIHSCNVSILKDL